MQKIKSRDLLLFSLVRRLNNVIPEHFLTESADSRFLLTYQDSIEVEVETGDFWEERRIKDAIEVSSYSILSNIQDAITLVIKDVWPKIDSQPTSLALPNIHWLSNDKLGLSFRIDDKIALQLESIDFNGLLN
ncbi:MAG: hypothetical protein ACRCYY_15455 [Trueperaceae bacterium]